MVVSLHAYGAVVLGAMRAHFSFCHPLSRANLLDSLMLPVLVIISVIQLPSCMEFHKNRHAGWIQKNESMESLPLKFIV